MPDLISHKPIRTNVKTLDEARVALQETEKRLQHIADGLNPIGTVTVDGAATIRGYVTLTLTDGTTVKLLVAN